MCLYSTHDGNRFKLNCHCGFFMCGYLVVECANHWNKNEVKCRTRRAFVFFCVMLWHGIFFQLIWTVSHAPMHKNKTFAINWIRRVKRNFTILNDKLDLFFECTLVQCAGNWLMDHVVWNIVTAQTEWTCALLFCSHILNVTPTKC